MANERTLSIIKPDATGKNLIGKIIARFEEEGLTIAGVKQGVAVAAARPRASTPCTASVRSSVSSSSS